MLRRLTSLAAAGALSLVAATANAQLNIALGKPVTAEGTFGVLRAGSIWAPASPPAAASTVTDGVFRPEGTLWTEQTVWWDATVPGSENNALIIDLGSVFSIIGLSIQADNNDEYRIDWRASASDPWIPNIWAPPCCAAGMRTRSGGFAPFDVQQFRLRAVNGDGYYAISEFPAIIATPEPATVTLVGAGVAVVAAAARRRRRLA